MTEEHWINAFAARQWQAHKNGGTEIFPERAKAVFAHWKTVDPVIAADLDLRNRGLSNGTQRDASN